MPKAKKLLEQGYCVVCEQQVDNLVVGTKVCEEHHDEFATHVLGDDFVNTDRFEFDEDE